MQKNTERLIRATRLVIGLFLGIMLGIWLKLPNAAWISVTITVVLFDQITLGGTLNRGFLRIAATLISAAISFITVYLFKNNWLIINAIILTCSFIYAYWFMDKKQSYIGVLGICTLFMILAPGNDDLKITALRALDTLLGVVVAILVMLLILPQFAKEKILHLLVGSLNKLEGFADCLVNQKYSIEELRYHFAALENGFFNNIVKFNRLIDEAKFESQAKKITTDYSNIFLHIRRVYRLLSIIFYNAAYNIPQAKPVLKQSLGNLVQVLKQLQQQLTSKSFNLNHVKLTQVYHQDLAQNQEIIFIQTILNHITNEINHLINEIKKLENK